MSLRTVRLRVPLPVLFLLIAAAPSAAEVNRTPIAVPLLGGHGAASPYPSTLTVRAIGGSTHRGQISVTLDAVTHPCPEDLAVLLVHNNTDKYLLMSNAGGCRPLQGTTIRIVSLGTPIPDTQPASPAYDSGLQIGPSNYGPAPEFPAPAPPGPYVMGLPPDTININGTWSLYVVDTGGSGRGVIAAGWAVNYFDPDVSAAQTDVPVPGHPTVSGGALAYPITFDLSLFPPAATVTRVNLFLTLRHTYPDDLRIVLQSPAGSAVVLMANAGGGHDLPAPGVTLAFDDLYASPVPDSTVITTGGYRPGGAYGGGTHALPAPAPPPPYNTSLNTFNTEPVRGAWKLWVYDDFPSSESGVVVGAAILRVFTQPSSNALTYTAPPESNPRQPFVRWTGTVTQPDGLVSASWRVTDELGQFLAAGPVAIDRDNSTFSAVIPVRKGMNHIRLKSLGVYAFGWNNLSIIPVTQFWYTLPEGATGDFFDLDVSVANPTATAAPIAVDFLSEGASPVNYTNSVGANAPFQITADTLIPAASVSTVVRSIDAVPLVVERTQSWDARGYGGHGGTAVTPSTRWLFAEGAQGYFDTFVLLTNDNDTAADVTVRFLLEDATVVTETVTVPGDARRTIYTGDIPALRDQSFGIDISASRAIGAERAMYFPRNGPRLWEGGHESAGVTATSRTWFLAEGATGSFFECFILLMNPNATPAETTLTYLLPDGSTLAQSLTIPANSRRTINVETVYPGLANTAVSTTVAADVGIVVERAMYWPDISQGWREAHNSFGVTELGLRWGIADGRIGGPRGYSTYLLLANPNPVPAEVQVRFLKAGAVETRFYTLPATSRVNIQAEADVPALGEGTFSADIQVLNYQPIAVEKAMYWNAEGVTWAAGTNVTAVPLPPP
jgi:hypothetical protein